MALSAPYNYKPTEDFSVVTAIIDSYNANEKVLRDQIAVLCNDINAKVKAREREYVESFIWKWSIETKEQPSKEAWGLRRFIATAYIGEEPVMRQSVSCPIIRKSHGFKIINKVVIFENFGDSGPYTPLKFFNNGYVLNDTLIQIIESGEVPDIFQKFEWEK